MKRIVILGGGESGCGAAVLAKEEEFDVFLSDMGSIPAKYKKILKKYGIRYEEEKHTEEEILAAAEIIKSPGIPDSAAIVRKIRDRGIPVISEIEFAGRYTDARKICITGSNGKTTTTTLIYNILRDAGFNAGLAGNIGESFALSVARGRHDAKSKHDWYVIELSSFQLDGMFKFRADISVLMNITPDHLDRYDYKLQKYIDSKFQILRNQTADDLFIYCGDDPLTLENIGTYGGTAVEKRSFSARKNEGQAAWLQGGRIFIRTDHGTEEFLSMSELHVRGIHNAYDVMAAVLASLQAGVPAESIKTTLKNFRGVEHRLEDCGEIDGVQYINDSKATNVDSTWYALESMTRPVVWIAGGTDKGNDYAPLFGLVREKVKALVCMGADNSKLMTDFEGITDVIADTHSLDDAMKEAKKYASAGDVVLLSPACASFDLFRNYEDRGNRFKQWIKASKKDI